MVNNVNRLDMAARAAPPAGPRPPANLLKPAGRSAGRGRAERDERQSVQNHLLFSEVRDGIIIMRDWSLRMIIMATALNFDLKSPQEQDAIEYSFQAFLNGLHFPIKIVVQSRKLDLTDYLNKLDR